MRGKTLLQELVCKDASLRQTPDGLAHLEINVSTDNFVEEVVLGDDLRGKQADGNFHVRTGGVLLLGRNFLCQGTCSVPLGC